MIAVLERPPAQFRYRQPDLASLDLQAVLAAAGGYRDSRHRWRSTSPPPLTTRSRARPIVSRRPCLYTMVWEPGDRTGAWSRPLCGACTSSPATCRPCATGGQSLRFTASARRWRQEGTRSKSLLRTLTGRETVPCQSEFRLIWKAFGSDIFLVLCSNVSIGHRPWVARLRAKS